MLHFILFFSFLFLFPSAEINQCTIGEYVVNLTLKDKAEIKVNKKIPISVGIYSEDMSILYRTLEKGLPTKLTYISYKDLKTGYYMFSINVEGQECLMKIYIKKI